jgi:signal transduction histidine kinase
LIAGHDTTEKPAVRERVIGPGGRSYIVEAVAQSSAAESEATRRLALILLLSPAVALLLGGAAALYLADRALRPVEEAYERERRFVSDAAHELRTPVTFLRLGVEELRASPDAIGEQQLADLTAEVARLTRLVQELLELSRLERARPEPRMETDVGAIAADVTDRFRPLAESHGIELQVDVPARSVRALASPSGVERILNILVDNALAHTQAGRVTLSVRRDERIEVDVADTGSGIPVERREEIFEAFVSDGGVHHRDRGPGVGLGLAIARRTAAAMGARLQVESTVGVGSTFTLSLEPA